MKFLFNRFQPLFNEAGDGGDGGGDGGNAGADGGELPALLGEDLSFSEGWQERVGEEAQGLTFKNLKDMAKSVREGTSTIGRINQEKADLTRQLEELKGGAPAAPELPTDPASYKAAFKLPENLPDGVNVPDEILDDVAKFAHENKIAPDVVSKFIEFQVAQAAKEGETLKNLEMTAVEGAKAKIRSLVGEQNYETTIANAKAAHDVLGLNLSPEDLVQNVTLVTSLAKLHSKVSPGTMRDLGIGAEGQSTESKLQQSNDILTNPKNPHYEAFRDNTHVNHKEAFDTYNRLIAESAQ